jgi:hypothetical protein
MYKFFYVLIAGYVQVIYGSCSSLFLLSNKNMAGVNRTQHLVARISLHGGINPRRGSGDHPIPACICSTRGADPQQPNEA